MKLIRHGEAGAEKPGMVDADGTLRDLSAHIHDIDGTQLAAISLAKIAALDPATLPALPADTRLGAPVAKIGKVICIGLNYADHAAESGMEVPAEPVIFMKATSAICGPNDPTEIPQGSEKTDWEVELGIVIGTRAKYVPAGQAMDHVAGYVLANDISERNFQAERCGQWVKGKSHDTFCPLGPWMVTADEVPDPQDLSMYLDVNDTRRQDGSTKTMVYGVEHVVGYLSQFMTLDPGDVILTGTPPGVGMGMTPQTYLQVGDTVALGIDGLGTQTHLCIDATN
ncbi:2-hydroxyhepta-2,4-diene-1,7-dioate isomerase [Thioclava sp. SK-1]|uniref:fumarylacetoacetate hydrolase family protein n=1 Tax=Thioclava sp. SK-1 TaxID=1889770 RepID=UPI000826F12A|nr:fumarylacetoacetate hydrolase family protein [Thioclava sp. SK-1]OCX64602.1 2-hydroxyhepta-2,4-diene-1,7-dioate isomerase [Thioclava sp. SK-1]